MINIHVGAVSPSCGCLKQAVSTNSSKFQGALLVEKNTVDVRNQAIFVDSFIPLTQASNLCLAQESLQQKSQKFNIFNTSASISKAWQTMLI